MDADFPRFVPAPLDLNGEDVPLSRWDDGSIRVTNSRVPVELVIHKFQWGETPEEVAREFDTVELDYARALEAFYQRRKADVDAYVANVDAQADAMQRYTESQPEYQALMARMQKKIDALKQSGNVAPAR